MGMSMLGGIGSAISGARQARKNRAHQLNMQRIQNEFNHNEAELSAQRNADEWTRQFNLTNAYNSPAAQMDRNRQAGLNPYMSNISDGNSNASVSASGSTAATSSNVPYADAYSNPVSDFLQGVNNTSQSALSTFAMLDKATTRKSDNASRIADNLLNADLFDLKKENLQAALRSETTRNNYDNALNSLRLHGVNDIYGAQIAEMYARVRAMEAEARKNETDEKVANETVRRMRASFHTWLEAFELDNDIKKSQRKSIDNGIEIANRSLENELANGVQGRKESNSRIALNGMLGALYGVQTLLGRQQYGFNGLMNPILITQGKYQNRKLWHEGSSSYYNAKHASYFTPDEQIFFDNPTLNSIDKWSYGIGSALDNFTRFLNNIPVKGNVVIGADKIFTPKRRPIGFR